MPRFEENAKSIVGEFSNHRGFELSGEANQELLQKERIYTILIVMIITYAFTVTNAIDKVS